VPKYHPSVDQSNHRYWLDFWSAYQAVVTITNVSQDLALPDVVVSGLPGRIAITRVTAIFKYRVVDNTSGAQNAITLGGGTPAIQVRDDTPGTYTDAIDLIEDMFLCPGSTIEGGDVLMGNTNLSAVVDGEDTYNFQLDDVLADGNNLILRDIQCGLRVEWRV